MRKADRGQRMWLCGRVPALHQKGSEFFSQPYQLEEGKKKGERKGRIFVLVKYRIVLNEKYGMIIYEFYLHDIFFSLFL